MINKFELNTMIKELFHMIQDEMNQYMGVDHINTRILNERICQ